MVNVANVVECLICNQEVARSNLGSLLVYFVQGLTQPSIPQGSVYEYQLRLERQRQVWLIPLSAEMQGVQVKLCYRLTMRAIPECFRDASLWRRDYLYFCTFTVQNYVVVSHAVRAHKGGPKIFGNTYPPTPPPLERDGVADP